jgi:DNA replication protein DnaC
MVSLGEILSKYKNRLDGLPDDVKYIPDDGVCEDCLRIKRDHPGVNRVLAARGFMRYDEDNDKYVYAQPVPRCECVNSKLQQEHHSEFMANLPLSARGAMPRSFIAGTFENFVPRPGTEEALDMCMDFLNENAPPILVLRGPRGTGKTHLMEAVGREMLARGKRVRYERVSTLLARMRSAYNSEQQGILEEGNTQYRNLVELLMLDDLGAEKPSDWVREQLYRLIDERYGVNRLLIVSTNESYEGLADNLGERIASRLFDTNSGKVAQVTMTCSDYRRE